MTDQIAGLDARTAGLDARTAGTKKIGIVVGSLRKNSNTSILANTLFGLLPDGFTGELVELGDLAIYNQDFDDPKLTPSSYISFRQNMLALDGFIFVTPEYNRSMPAVVKNALDIGSRPYGQSVWNGKPCAVVSSSPGPIGGFGSSQHLKQTLGFLNLKIMQQPEMYLGGISESIDDTGALSERTSKFLQKFVIAFVEWVDGESNKGS